MANEYYLEYLPSCGGVNFVIGRCDLNWLKVEAYVDWGLGRLFVLLDGERVINESAIVGHTVSKEVTVSPPKSCTNITVAVSDPATLAISKIKVWYTCVEELPEPEFEIVSVRFEQ